MPTVPRDALLRTLRSAAPPAADADLLTQFINDRNEAAFAVIVERHGPLVFNSCRRMLGHTADAEDAFQAVFLALARNARSVRKRDSLATWLYGAAYRVCLKARRGRSRLHTKNARVEKSIEPDPLAGLTAREFLSILDDELAHLPDRFRLPLVLCLVEGLSQEEAAGQLGWTPGSVKGRLERGRNKLRRRLAARGVALATLLAAASLNSATAAIPPALFARALETITARSTPAAIAALAAAATSSSATITRVTAALALCAAIAAVATLGGAERPAPKPGEEPPKPALPATARVDKFGDPLPEGAVMRLGTTRFRVPGITSVGFRPNGDLVALTYASELHVWPADGAGKAAVTSLTEKKWFGNHPTISPNARFAADCVSGKLIVWDLSGKEPVEYLSRAASGGICFSANGEWLAVEQRTNGLSKLLLCNLLAKEWHELPIAHSAESLTFTPDGRSLTVAAGTAITVIDTATRKERLSIRNAGRPGFAGLSPDGKVLAIQPRPFIRGPERVTRLVSVPRGEEITQLKPPRGYAHWVDFSPGGRSLLLGGQDGVREWDLASGTLKRESAWPAQAPPVYSADGRRFASYSMSAVLLGDATTNRALRPDLIDGGHTNPVSAIAFSRDGKVVATSTFNEIRLWEAKTGALLCRVQSRWGAFLEDSKSFVAFANDWATPIVWDIATGNELRRFAVPPELLTTHMIRHVRLSPDGTFLYGEMQPAVTTGKSHGIRWDVGTGKVIDQTELTRPRSDADFVKTSPDMKWEADPVSVSRVGTNETTRILAPTDGASLLSPPFSTDSRLLALVRVPRAAEPSGPGAKAGETSIVIFDLVAGKRIGELLTGEFFRIAFSPDGRSLAVARRGEVAIWDISSKKRVARFVDENNIAHPYALAFSPDGRRLVTGHDDCTALVWDLSGTRPATAASPLSADALTKAWDALAGGDAAKAYAAGWELANRPGQAVPLIRERVKPVRPANEAKVKKLLDRLGSPAFAEREAATKELHDLGEPATPYLREALKGDLSAEQKTRIGKLLAELTGPATLPPGELLRQVRAVAVLEHAATEEARKLLRDLAGGVTDARLTREAAEALEARQNNRAQVIAVLAPQWYAGQHSHRCLRLPMHWRVLPLLLAMLLPAGVFADSKSKPPPPPIVPEPLTLQAGQAMSTHALTQRPAPLPGLRGWTLETKRHRGPMYAFAFSPDEKLLATGGHDCAIRLWDMGTGKLLRVLIGHNYVITSLAFSPDGKILASAGSADGTVRLWDPHDGQPLRTFPMKAGNANWVGWSADGGLLACAGGTSGYVWVYDLTSDKGSVVTEVGNPIYSIAWAHESRVLAVCAPKVPLSLVDPGAGADKVTTLGEASDNPQSAAWSPDDKLLAVGTTSAVYVWDVPGKKKLESLVTYGANVAWSRDGKTLATSYTLGSTTFWDAQSWKMLRPAVAAAAAYKLNWQKDNLLAVLDYTKLSLWKPDGEAPVKSLELAGQTPPQWQSGRPVITGIGDKTLQLWSATTGKRIATLDYHSAPVSTAVWSKDGRFLASGGHDGKIVIWDSAGKYVTRCENAGVVISLSWSPDGKQLASGSTDHKVLVWDAASGKREKTFEEHKAPVYALAWCPAGKLLAAGGYDQRIKIWNVETGKAEELPKDWPAGQALAWSSNGKLLATGGGSDALRFWTPVGKAPPQIGERAPQPPVTLLSWAPGNELLAVCRTGAGIALYGVHREIERNKPLQSLATWGSAIHVGWSAKAETIAVGCSDRTVRFFDTASAQLRAMLITEPAGTLATIPEGHYKCDTAVEADLIFVAQTERGQDLLTPPAFAKKYKWKNIPTAVKLTGN